MNREDVIQLAKEVGYSVIESAEPWNESTRLLERFAAAVEQRTLERAALELENEITQSGENVAAAIRALKETQ